MNDKILVGGLGQLKIKAQEKTRLEAWFQPMGFSLHIITDSPAVLAAAETSFGGYGPARPGPTPDFTFRLFQADAPPEAGPPAQPVFHTEGDLACQTLGTEARLVADRATGRVEGRFSARILANPPFFRWHFLEFAFFVMLAGRGVMGVHASALAKNGRAILLRAQSGGGKTTLAYAGARRKFQALAEDVVWIDWQRQVWWGAPWSFHLLPDAKNHFPELAPYEPVLQTNGEMKLEVNLEHVRPGSTAVCARPGPVVLVERAPGQKSRLEPVGLPEAKAAWQAGYAGGEREFPDYERRVEALLGDNTYRLYFGDDIEGSVDLLEPLFA